MKKLLFMAMLVAVLTPAMVLAQAAHTEVTSCGACHTPHGAGMLAGVPLWDPDQDLTGVFEMYGEVTPSPTLDAIVADEPDGSARLCLSCHDGSPTDLIPGVTHNLSNTHPISFDYNTALSNTDSELYDPAIRLSGVAGSTAGTIAVDLLQGTSRMQCVGCHDIHSSGVTAAFLYDITTGAQPVTIGNPSALCQVCHDK